MNIVYLNGIKVDPDNKISLFNPSFLYGINVFEGIRGYWNESKAEYFIFDLDQHIDRLYKSLFCIQFNTPINKISLINELYEIIKKEQLCENIYIRITFFINTETSWSEKESIGYFISIRSISSNLVNPIPLSLGLSSYLRISSESMPPFVKAGANYLNSRYALLDTQSKGFDGALFLSQKGFISESTGSCIFFIKDNALYTPSVNSDILVGITRNRIIHLSALLNIQVIEKNIYPDELQTFECAFLAGTMIEVKPISKINEMNFNISHSLFNKLLIGFKNYIYGMEL